jgi:AraC family transcriptional regulator of adaptative response/methylated-DNA-[protein]-cysteine methyltransferase
MSTTSRSNAAPPITPRAADHFWQAIEQRDSACDGAFVFGVRSTRIYCRPSCPARRPLRRNTLFFRTNEEAESFGYRPCRRCRPQEQDEATGLIRRATAILRESEEEPVGISSLAAQLKTSAAKLRRAFHRITGLSPREFSQALRLERLKKLLREGANITEALYECGYGSSSRLYEKTNSQLGMTPASYRKGGAGMRIGYTLVNTTLGKVLVAATERGVSAVYLGESERTLVESLRDEYPRAELFRAAGEEGWLREIVRRVEGAPPSLDLPLDVQATVFQRRVWQELQKIPRGTTRTYTQVARALGKPRSVRAVARACSTNPVSIVVPCHRVVRMDGSLAGYRWGMARKQKLLEREAAASA